MNRPFFGKNYILIIAICLTCFNLYAQVQDEAKKKKVVYQYKEYEKHDLEGLDVDADSAGDGNLSITPREQIKFKNKLPLKRNFNREIKKSVENSN